MLSPRLCSRYGPPLLCDGPCGTAHSKRCPRSTNGTRRALGAARREGPANMDPTKLDSKRLRELVDKYSYSDIGHCDVVDMRDPLPEAYQLVEDGHITESDFSDCIFGNAVRLWGTQNPRVLPRHAGGEGGGGATKGEYAGTRGGVIELGANRRPVLDCYERGSLAANANRSCRRRGAIARHAIAGKAKLSDLAARFQPTKRYRPRTTSIPESTSSSFDRESLLTRSVRSSLSIATICETLATESFGRPVMRLLRATFPGASAHRRLLVSGTATTVAMRLRFKASP